MEGERRAKPAEARITLAMAVRNEAGRHLERVLAHAARYVDAAAIVDNASEDSTVELCRRVLAGIPLRLAANPEHCPDESVLRRQVWNLAAGTGPGWILLLDADEIFEERAVEELPRLAASPNVDVYYFRLYDFWDEEHYRDDRYWRAHRRYHPFLIRHRRDFACEWADLPLHCGRTPINLKRLPGAASLLRLKHLGWMRPEDRMARYRRYTALDPEGRLHSAAQYRSILDPEPRLVRWIEEGAANPLESRFLVRSDPAAGPACREHPLLAWREARIREWARRLLTPGDAVLALGRGPTEPGAGGGTGFCTSAAETPLPFPEASFAKVFWLAGLEGRTPAEIAGILRECRRVLKQRGLLALSFTLPPLDAAFLDRVCAEAGLDYAGEVSPLPTVDALPGPLADGGGLGFCFRAALRRIEDL